jgi:hypothetical protein
MCFSAGASFATGAVLLPAGAYCVTRAATGPRSYLPLSAIPLVFGAQQFFEGLVWIGLGRNDALLARTASLSFLFFALVFWPFWIPFCALFVEKRRRVRRGLGLVACAALCAGLVFYVPLAMHAGDWLHVGILQHSIRYEFEMSPGFADLPRIVWQLGYIAVVVTPLFVTSDWKYRTFGVLLVASAVLSQAAFWYAFISVWCAFSAILSAWLCYMLSVRAPVGATGATGRGRSW